MSTSSSRVLQVCLFLIAALLGASVAFTLLEHSVSVEAVTNITVAIGTLALAYFTWQSVRKTSDVIAGEDRRHQLGFAPLLIASTQKVEKGGFPGVGTFEIATHTVLNKGLGLAQHISVEFDGTYLAQTYPLLQPGEFFELKVPEGTVPGGWMKIKCLDMFANEYTTEYRNKNVFSEWIWVKPDNLETMDLPPRIQLLQSQPKQ